MFLKLWIIKQSLWGATKFRRGALKIKGTSDNIWDRHQLCTLLSGLLRCGCCCGGFSKVNKTDFDCSTTRNKDKGLYTNSLALSQTNLEAQSHECNSRTRKRLKKELATTSVVVSNPLTDGALGLEGLEHVKGNAAAPMSPIEKLHCSVASITQTSARGVRETYTEADIRGSPHHRQLRAVSAKHCPQAKRKPKVFSKQQIQPVPKLGLRAQRH
jgi:hypothetical protein